MQSHSKILLVAAIVASLAFGMVACSSSSKIMDKEMKGRSTYKISKRWFKNVPAALNTNATLENQISLVNALCYDSLESTVWLQYEGESGFTPVPYDSVEYCEEDVIKHRSRPISDRVVIHSAGLFFGAMSWIVFGNIFAGIGEEAAFILMDAITSYNYARYSEGNLYDICPYHSPLEKQEWFRQYECFTDYSVRTISSSSSISLEESSSSFVWTEKYPPGAVRMMASSSSEAFTIPPHQPSQYDSGISSSEQKMSSAETSSSSANISATSSS